MHHLKHILFTLLLLPALGARAQVTSFYVAPHAMDTAYTTAQDSSYVCIDASVASNGKLLIFLDGSGSNTKDYTYYPQLAAALGYHCISVAYPNSPTVGSLCSASSDSLCYDKVRQEICYGTDASTLVSVDTFNSIYTRTVKLLQYLAATYPSAGWDAFLSGGVPVWASIVMSGHSQGSGHALYFAKTHPVYRVVMFSGADDYSAWYSAPAHWIHNASATPVSSYYSFLHLQDDVVPYSEEFAIVQALGMTASGDDSTLVDHISFPYLNSHCLYTDATPNHVSIASSYHDATVVDFFTPLGGSGYLFDSVWYYTLQIPATTGIESPSQQPAFSLYPVPARDVINLLPQSTGAGRVQITDLSGRVLISVSAVFQKGSPMAMGIASLPPGAYVIQAQGATRLFIKE